MREREGRKKRYWKNWAGNGNAVSTVRCYSFWARFDSLEPRALLFLQEGSEIALWVSVQTEADFWPPAGDGAPAGTQQRSPCRVRSSCYTPVTPGGPCYTETPCYNHGPCYEQAPVLYQRAFYQRPEVRI